MTLASALAKILMTWHIWNFIKEWYRIPLLLIYAGVIITILSENRNPSKSLAYILVLVFLPVIGLLVCYFVGRKPIFKKWQFKRKRLIEQLKMQQYTVMDRTITELKIGEIACLDYYKIKEFRSLQEYNEKWYLATCKLI